MNSRASCILRPYIPAQDGGLEARPHLHRYEGGLPDSGPFLTGTQRPVPDCSPKPEVRPTLSCICAWGKVWQPAPPRPRDYHTELISCSPYTPCVGRWVTPNSRLTEVPPAPSGLTHKGPSLHKAGELCLAVPALCKQAQVAPVSDCLHSQSTFQDKGHR